MNSADNEKLVKEMLKKILDNDTGISQSAKSDLKVIIETEHNPEKLLQKCLFYMYLCRS